METTKTLKSSTSSHPLITMLLFGAITAGLVGAGSYVSKQRSVERALEVDSGAAITFFESGR